MKQVKLPNGAILYFSIKYSLLTDKINQWGHHFRESYTRLSLLKPFMADNAGIFFLTATATSEDEKVGFRGV